MKKDSHDAHKKFLTAFIKTESLEDAIKQSGLSRKKAQYYLNKYKHLYVGLFEKLGMPKEAVIQRHIALIDKPKASIHTFKGITTTHYDNKTQLKAIALYYELISAIKDDPIIINNDISNGDKLKELAIARLIDKDSALREKFMNLIETETKGA